jgi:plastocyanin
MKKLFIVFLALAVGLTFTLSTDAKKKKKKKSKYKVIEVTNGGSIAGKALFAGANPPSDETVTLTSEQSLCGDTLPAEKYLISANKEIKNVVVYLSSIKKGKAIPKEKALVDNKMCAFVPHVSVGFKGNKIDIINSDPVFHNVHSYIKGKTTYNLGLPDPGSKVTKKMKRDGIMEVKCDSHPWMIGYVFISKHPYAVATNEAGDFSITDIPAGSYKVKAWHEGLGEIDLGKVTVEAGKTAKVNAEFK